MNILKLSSELSFAIEPLEKRVRLVVYNNGVENVCRMESIKNLENFIQSGDSHLFKGRLQLYKNAANIVVEVKGEIAGVIRSTEFIKLLEIAKGKEIKTL